VHVALIGGNEFTDFMVPLSICDRYFILEPGNPDPRVSVMVIHEGNAAFEILRNQPIDNPLSTVTKTPPGILTILTVSDRESGRFLYKVRPTSETSVVFGTIEGEEMTVAISDRQIRINNGNTFENNGLHGIGLSIDAHGGFAIGSSIPSAILKPSRPA
jgi:hypothetical protein